MLISLLLFLCLASPLQADDVCLLYGQTASPGSLPRPETTQGPPGKRGAPGSPGPQGNPGPAGECVCDVSGMEELRRQVQEIRENLLRVPDYTVALETRCYAGLKDGSILDDQISSSSIFDARYEARYGRLDAESPGASNLGGWLGLRTPGEWIQVDFLSPIRIVGVVTQGLAANYPYWATSYKISYGNSTSNMQVMQGDDGEDRIFQGNRDRTTKVTNLFPEPITARFVRLIVLTWNQWGAVRLEYLTC